MFKGKTIVGIITARANSKRIVGKNTKLLGKKPLINWTFDTAKKSKYIDRLFVTTDSDEIINLAKKQQIEVPFKRPKYISKSSSTSEETVIHAMKWLKKNDNTYYEYVMLLQPTSPFRTNIHIDEAIEHIILSKNADALVSVNDFSKKALLLKTITKEGYLVNNVKNKNQLYLPNGAIYIIKTEILIKLQTMYPPKTIPYIMDDNSSIDIDTEEDFKKASIIKIYKNEKTN